VAPSLVSMSAVTPIPMTIPLRARVVGYVALTKPRIIELLLVTTVPTMFLAEQGVPSVWLILSTVLGGALAAGGANAINMFVDRDIDRMMERTKNRPLVTGIIRARNALRFAIVLEFLAFFWLLMTVNLLSAVLAVSATLFYVFVYTLWLKRTSTQNIVIGGAAGAVPVLVGWSAVTGSLGWVPVCLFLIIFYWTPPHFWALAIRYREDYAVASVPMLPSVTSLEATAKSILRYTGILVVLTLGFWPVAQLGLIYGTSALVFGTLFVVFALSVWKEPSERAAMRLFSYSITYVVLLFSSITLDVLV